jgi:hypothetical protein
MINEMLMWKDELITKHLPLNPHMSEHVFVQYSKECLLKGKQTLACVSDPPKKLAIGGKTKLLRSQRVGHESRHLRVTWFEHLIMPFGRGKCRSQLMLQHLEE